MLDSRPITSKPLVAISAGLLATAVAVGSAVAQPSPAGAAALPAVEATAVPLVGSTLSTSDLRNDVDRDDYTTVDYRVSWSSTSPGVERFDVYAVYAGTEPDLLGTFPAGPSAQDSVTDAISDYDGDLGGGSFVQVGWRVEAVDTRGRVGSVDVGRQPRVVQEDGASANGGSVRVRLGDGWRVRTCGCASGGAEAVTRRRGAAARVVPPRGDGATSLVSLVMGHGPRNGEAVVRVDGRRAGVVDTHAPVRRDRVVSWVAEVPSGSVVEVRNRATRDHPRLRFDALVIG